MRAPSPPRRPWLLALLLTPLVAFGAACSIDTPTSPTPPTALTGQTDNEEASFDGTLTIFGGGTALADGETDVQIVVEVVDENGNPAQNFTPVNFSTNLGTVRESGTDPALAGSTVRVNTFGGRASVLLRSSNAGIATVTAWIADTATTARVRFEAGPSTDVITLALRSGGVDVSTLQATAPLITTVVAKVEDEDGAPLAGRTVRFRIRTDTAGARLTGASRTLTDSIGEASSVLEVTGVGTVSLVAELLDASNNVVGESNHAIVTTTAEASAFEMTLVWDAGGTTTSAAVPDTVGMNVTVVDAATGAALSGRRIRFLITSDTATADPAQLAHTGTSNTNGSGVATNAVTVREADSVVVIEAHLVDANGFFVAASNHIVLEAEAPEEDEDGS